MRRSRKEMEAEIGRPELNVETGLGNYDPGETDSRRIHSHVSNTSRRVSVEVAYVEAPVMVTTTEEESEKRRCSICLN